MTPLALGQDNVGAARTTPQRPTPDIIAPKNSAANATLPQFIVVRELDDDVNSASDPIARLDEEHVRRGGVEDGTRIASQVETAERLRVAA